MLTVMKTALLKMQISIDQPHTEPEPEPATAGQSLGQYYESETHMVRQNRFPLD